MNQNAVIYIYHYRKLHEPFRQYYQSFWLQHLISTKHSSSFFSPYPFIPSGSLARYATPSQQSQWTAEDGTQKTGQTMTVTADNSRKSIFNYWPWYTTRLSAEDSRFQLSSHFTLRVSLQNPASNRLKPSTFVECLFNQPSLNATPLKCSTCCPWSHNPWSQSLLRWQGRIWHNHNNFTLHCTMNTASGFQVLLSAGSYLISSHYSTHIYIQLTLFNSHYSTHF